MTNHGVEWRDRTYSKLPGHVRSAIETAKQKQAHSDFYYKLQNLNEKLTDYSKIFKSNQQVHKKRIEQKKLREKEQREAYLKIK